MNGFVQGASQGVTHSGGLVAMQFLNPTINGNMIVALIITDATGLGNVTSVFDSYGNDYTRINDFSSGTSNYTMWYAWNVDGGVGHQVTAAYNISGAAHACIIAQEFAGAMTDSDPLDQHTHVIGTSTTPTSGATPVLSQANEIIVGGVSIDSLTSMIPGSGYSNVTTNGSGGANVVAGMESKVVAVTTAVSATWTLGASKNYSANIATFLIDPQHFVNVGQAQEADEAHIVVKGPPPDPNAQLAPAYGPGLVGAITSQAVNWPGNYRTGPILVNIGQAQEADSLGIITGPLVRVTAVTMPDVITPAASLPHASDVGEYPAGELADALLANSRVDRFRFELLNDSLTSLGFLDDVEIAGSVTYAHDSDIKRTATITIVETPATVGIKYETDRIKPYYDLLMPDGMWARFPLGVFLLTSPTRSIKGGIVTRDVAAYDLTAVLTQDKTPDRYALPIGTNVVDTVRDIMDDHHLNYLIGDADDVLTAAKDWDPGTSWYQIIADLLAMIAWRPLWFDPDGLGRTMLNVTPLDRQIDFVYPDDSLSVLDPEATEELDLWDVPNTWVLIASTPANAPIVSTYTNDNQDSPTSTATRGRMVTKVVSDSIDATTQDALDQLAQSMAFEDSQVYQSLTFNTAIMPQHGDYDVLRLVYGAFGINGIYAETDWSLPLQSGGLMSHSARRVVDVRHPIPDDIVFSDTQIIHQAGETEAPQAFTVIKTPPVTAHTSTFTATYHRTYPGNAWNIGYISPEPASVHAGQNDSALIKRGIFGFNFASIQAALAGATITAVYLNFKMQYTHSSSGATWYIGTHTYTSIPVNWDGDVHVAKRGRLSMHVVAGVTYHQSLGVSFGNDFKSGAALGIAIGPPPTSSSSYYGYMASNPTLEFHYTK